MLESENSFPELAQLGKDKPSLLARSRNTQGRYGNAVIEHPDGTRAFYRKGGRTLAGGLELSGLRAGVLNGEGSPSGIAGNGQRHVGSTRPGTP